MAKLVWSETSDPTRWEVADHFGESISFASHADAKKAEVLCNAMLAEIERLSSLQYVPRAERDGKIRELHRVPGDWLIVSDDGKMWAWQEGQWRLHE